MRRIICVGNRYVAGDDAGAMVHDYLQRTGYPDGIEVHDGGLAGLDLALLVDGADRVVFVDQVRGLAEPGAVVELTAAAVTASGHGASVAFDHAAGLPYLLRCLPHACDSPPDSARDVWLVGIEGPVTRAETIAEAAALSIARATADRGGRHRGERT